jgi:hypothetical protein
VLSVSQEAKQKAAELEKLSTVGRELLNKSISAGGLDGPSPTKKARVEAEGSVEDKAVDAFLKAFAAIPIDSMSASDALRSVQALLSSQGDALVKAVGLQQ